MGLFGNSKWLTICPICDQIAGTKPGAASDWWRQILGTYDSELSRQAVDHYRRLEMGNLTAHHICWPAVVAMYASRQGILEWKQKLENSMPQGIGKHSKDSFDALLNGKCNHDPMVR